MRQKIYIGAAIIFVISILTLLIYGLFFASNPKEIPSALVTTKAKPFSFTSFDGQKLSLNQFEGRPIVLNFWASWCFACRQEAHILEAAHQKYSPLGAVFIGIAINDKREDSLQFIQKYRKTYLLAPDDASGSISIDYGVTAVPETFLIDGTGIIQHKQLGVVTTELIENFLKNQLMVQSTIPQK
jgi:cytochrome c biogenesis protein CcmG, thiol:disulfide interchange protein DsbE